MTGKGKIYTPIGHIDTVRKHNVTEPQQTRKKISTLFAKPATKAKLKSTEADTIKM